MKILEHILDTIIQDQVSISNMQFGFIPGIGTTDVIFILRRLREKDMQKKKNIYFAFVDQEKDFNGIIQIVGSMYDNAHSKFRITNSYSNPINDSVWVHQGSVLSPLLFIIVMETLSREFKSDCSWELFTLITLSL